MDNYVTWQELAELANIIAAYAALVVSVYYYHKKK